MTTPINNNASPFPAALQKIWYPAILVAVWILTRVFPWSKMHSWTYWEVQEAKKLLEYGFWERAGAFINIHFMTGTLARPEAFNYVDHPVVPFWVDVLLYKMAGGGGGIVIANACIGLLSVLLTYVILSHVYNARLAFFSSLLFAVAPVAILYDVDPNLTALTSIAWPLLVLSVQKALERQRFGLALAGLIAFFVSVAEWFVWPLLGTIGICLLFFPLVSKKIDWRLFLVLLLGGICGVIVFLIQIYCHVPNIHEVWRYLGKQLGNEERSLFLTLFGIGLRGLLSIGLALIVGAVIRVFQLRQSQAYKSLNFLEVLSLTYIGVFLVVTLCLKGFMWGEEHPYEFLLFPCAVLTCSALSRTSSKFLRWILAILALCGALYPQIQATIPRVTQRSMTIAKYIGDTTTPRQLILTNIQEMKAPLLSWDVGATRYIPIRSDRIIRWNTNSAEELQKRETQFRGQLESVVFLISAEAPLDPKLQKKMDLQNAEDVTISVPIDNPGFAFELRKFYWKISGRYTDRASDERPTTPQVIKLKRYSWKLE